MNKGVIGLTIAIIVISVAVTGFAIYRNSNKSIDDNIEETIANKQEKNINTDNGENTNIANKENSTNNSEGTTKRGSKILVVYYSAQNHTKSVAEKVAKNLNADIFEIVPEEVYSNDDLNWTNSNSRVSREHNDESLRNVKLKNTKVNNFDGKRVIPFCTSASSGLGQSGELLKKEADSGNWQEGHRFSSGASDSDIKKWTDNLE